MSEEQVGGVTFTGEQGPGDAGNAENGGGPADILSMIPEEYKEASWATKYETAEDFFKGVDGMSKVVGQKAEGIVKPGEDATEDDWNDFYNKLGVPESPDEYVLSVDSRFKELFHEGDDKAVANLFHAAKLTPEQANALLPAYMEYRGAQVEQMKAAQVEQYKAAETALKNEWGAKYDDNLAAAAKGLDKAGVLEELEKSGLGNHPAIIKLGEVLNRALGEDYQREGESLSQAASVAAMERELDKITANPKFLNDQELKEKAFDLSKKINQMKRGQGQGAKNIPAFSAR